MTKEICEINDEEIKELQDRIDKVEKFYNDLIILFVCEMDDEERVAYPYKKIDFAAYNARLKCFDSVLKKLKSDLKVLTDRKVCSGIAKLYSVNLLAKLDELNKVDKPKNPKDPFNMCKWYIYYIDRKPYYVASCTPKSDNGTPIYYMYLNKNNFYAFDAIKCGCGKLVQCEV